MGRTIEKKKGKFIITNTCSNSVTKPCTLREAIAHISGSEIFRHRETIIEYYMTFPDGWSKGDCTIWTCNPRAKKDYHKFILKILDRPDAWEIVEETYNEIYAVLNDDNAEYKPYTEFKWLKELLKDE